MDHQQFSRRIVVRASTSALNPEAMADFKIFLSQVKAAQDLPITTIFTLA